MPFPYFARGKLVLAVCQQSLKMPAQRIRVRLQTMKLQIILAALCVLSGWQATAQIYDTNNNVVQIFAGSGTQGYLEGQGTQAMFSSPQGVVADTSGNLFVIDGGNGRIRKITTNGMTSTFGLP